MRRFLISTLCALATATAMPMAQARNQPARPAEPSKAAEPAAAAEIIHLSPSALRQIQTGLKAGGHDPGGTTGVWTERAAKALSAFQSSQGIEPSGHVDLRTLVALKMTDILDGQPSRAPAAAAPEASASPAPGAKVPASRADGIPLFADPIIVSQVQQALMKNGAIPDNILGFWRDKTAQVTREYQKAHNLDPTGTVDLQLIHALGLDGLLAQPPAKGVEIMSDSQAPFAGVPLAIGPSSLRLVQQALGKKGFNVGSDGRWTEESADAVKKFQQGSGLDAIGHLDPATLRALGFEHPLVDLARASDAKS